MNGPEQAFELLVKEHKSTIYSVCFMFADSRMEADDLFQESLVNLWQGSTRFRGDSTLRSWIYRVTLNTCISAKRRKHVHATAMAGGDVPEIYSDATEAGRQSQLLRQRIGRLDVMDRAIVLLWLENLPYEEIGAIVGLTPKAVGVRLVRIKEKLKKTAE